MHFAVNLMIYIMYLLGCFGLRFFGLQDIASKITAFSQQGPRTVCILSANGAISNVTLRQPAMSGGTVTYEVSTFVLHFFYYILLNVTTLFRLLYMLLNLFYNMGFFKRV